MASIKRRGQKWIVRWRDGSGRQHTRSCPTKADAEALRIDIEGKVSRGQDWVDERVREVPCLTEVSKVYLAHRSLRLSALTIRQYAYSLDNFFDFLGQRFKKPFPPSLLSRPLLEDYYLWLSRPGTARGNKTRGDSMKSNMMAVVQQMWAWAEDSERWPGLFPRAKRIDVRRCVPKAVRAPTWAEMAMCVTAAEDWRKKLTTVLYYTGLRVGETMLLDWSDVDMQDRTLVIRPEVSKVRKAARTVPLPKALIQEMAGWGKREGWLIQTGLRSERRSQATTPPMANIWKSTQARPVVYKGCPHHAFRHGYKTNMLRAGAHPDAVDFLQGHGITTNSRWRYIDAELSFDLASAVELVPPLKDHRNVVLITASQAEN